MLDYSPVHECLRSRHLDEPMSSFYTDNAPIFHPSALVPPTFCLVKPSISSADHGHLIPSHPVSNTPPKRPVVKITEPEKKKKNMYRR